MIISNTLRGRQFPIARHTRTGRELFLGAFLLSFAGSLAGSLGLVFLSDPVHWLTGSLVGGLLTIVAFGGHLLRRSRHRPANTTGSPIDR